MQLSKKWKYIITIAFVVVYSFIMIYFSPLEQIVKAYGKIDSDSKHLLSTVIIAGLGLALFGLKHLPIKEETLEQLEAWDLALLIVFPSAEAFAYIAKDISNWPWAILAYIAGVMMWFVLVICKHKVFKDPKEEKKFTLTMGYVMFVFVVYGTYAFLAFNTLTQLK